MDQCGANPSTAKLGNDVAGCDPRGYVRVLRDGHSLERPYAEGSTRFGESDHADRQAAFGIGELAEVVQRAATSTRAVPLGPLVLESTGELRNHLGAFSQEL
jgi:hypothetical protein